MRAQGSWGDLAVPPNSSRRTTASSSPSCDSTGSTRRSRPTTTSSGESTSATGSPFGARLHDGPPRREQKRGVRRSDERNVSLLRLMGRFRTRIWKHHDVRVQGRESTRPRHIHGSTGPGLRARLCRNHGRRVQRLPKQGLGAHRTSSGVSVSEKAASRPLQGSLTLRITSISMAS